MLRGFGDHTRQSEGKFDDERMTNTGHVFKVLHTCSHTCIRFNRWVSLTSA